ncbi:MAG: NAD-dependent epimerase/dehydratase family protein [Anaerolineae bacterium]|nr:NAD-dependent epimerase/dehydratase family protein [Anaerolineae bacterium]
MQHIAIVGASGYIGSRLATYLGRLDDVERILGIDVRPTPVKCTKLRFEARSVLDPLAQLFREHRITSAINLAFVVHPSRNREKTEEIDVGGNRRFLEACRDSGVEHVLYLSSHSVYGAHPDNPVPLTETCPPRPLYDFQYSWDKVQTEQLLHQFAGENPAITVTILRVCPVIGPHAADAIVALMFKPKIMIGVAGYDPGLQFVHEDDLTSVIAEFLRLRLPGAYNVAADGTIPYSQVARIAKRRMLKLPNGLLRAVMGISWSLHLQHDSPPSGLEFIKYPPVLDNRKVKKALPFHFSYNSEAALQSYLSQLH